MGELGGRVASVTGGARGQVRSHAIASAEAGADVILIELCADNAVDRVVQQAIAGGSAQRS